MAINKAMLLALKALSYPEPDITKTYKLHRAVVDVKAPFGRFYRLWDKPLIAAAIRFRCGSMSPRSAAQKSCCCFSTAAAG